MCHDPSSVLLHEWILNLLHAAARRHHHNCRPSAHLQEALNRLQTWMSAAPLQITLDNQLRCSGKPCTTGLVRPHNETEVACVVRDSQRVVGIYESTTVMSRDDWASAHNRWPHKRCKHDVRHFASIIGRVARRLHTSDVLLRFV